MFQIKIIADYCKAEPHVHFLSSTFITSKTLQLFLILCGIMERKFKKYFGVFILARRSAKNKHFFTSCFQCYATLCILTHLRVSYAKFELSVNTYVSFIEILLCITLCYSVLLTIHVSVICPMLYQITLSLLLSTILPLWL